LKGQGGKTFIEPKSAVSNERRKKSSSRNVRRISAKGEAEKDLERENGGKDENNTRAPRINYQT